MDAIMKSKVYGLKFIVLLTLIISSCSEEPTPKQLKRIQDKTDLKHECFRYGKERDVKGD